MTKPMSLLLLALSPSLAFAHPLTSHAAFAAFLHPLLGLDHLVVMLLIGVWAGWSRDGRDVALPLAFLAALGAGAGLAHAGVVLPVAEAGIAASLLAFAWVTLREARVARLPGLALCAGAGLWHGHAHGVELASAGLAAWCFVLGSCALHGIGWALASGAHASRPAFARTLAVVSAVLGGWLLAGA